MQTTANLPRRIKDKPDNTDHSVHQVTAYTVIGVILLIILALLFIFPLYWILTGSFKTQQAVNSAVPVWFPTGETVTMRNYNELFNRPAITWLLNTVFICAAAMGLTCIAASMGGYALAKKRFAGRTLLFSVFIPKWRAARDEHKDLERKIEVKTGEAWQQMAPLNALYDWDITP
ncbi:MAG: carbohydrate ABC transporter permease, partial [Clostridia bacterium]|nr:carbohydrate ABC transporter permease [Clostridia bacterium]